MRGGRYNEERHHSYRTVESEKRMKMTLCLGRDSPHQKHMTGDVHQ
jgi:hypothetical protein